MRGARIFLWFLSISIYVASPADEGSPRGQVLLTKDLRSYVGSDLVLNVRELEFPPSFRGEKDRHPGPVVVCVLEGELEVAPEGTTPKTYSSGQCFTEEPHRLHLYSRNPSKTAPVRVISYLLSHSGEPLSRPEE
jgi:quercetin dioxygenase-like cupin family protein